MVREGISFGKILYHYKGNNARNEHSDTGDCVDALVVQLHASLFAIYF